MIGFRPFFTGIAGGSASGKSTFTPELRERVDADSSLVGVDAYYLDLLDNPFYDPEVGKDGLNFDDPRSIDSRLLVRDLSELAAGRAIQMPIYDFVTSRRTGYRVVEPNRYIFVEGLFVLHWPDVRALLHHSIYFKASQATRERRRIPRDLERAGDSEEQIIARLYNFVFPAHDKFIGPSKRFAQVTFENNTDDFAALQGFASEQAALISALAAAA